MECGHFIHPALLYLLQPHKCPIWGKDSALSPGRVRLIKRLSSTTLPVLCEQAGELRESLNSRPGKDCTKPSSFQCRASRCPDPLQDPQQVTPPCVLERLPCLPSLAVQSLQAVTVTTSSAFTGHPAGSFIPQTCPMLGLLPVLGTQIC